MTRASLALLPILLAGAPVPAAEQRLEVVFVGDGAGPMAVVELVERGEGQRISRSAAWAFFAGDASVTKALSDVVRGARTAPPLVDLPGAPAGLGLTSDVDGTLVFTLSELGDWQARLPSAATPSAAPGGPPVPSASSARLLVEPPPTSVPTRQYTTRATLYGSAGAYTGLAVVDTRSGGRQGSTLVVRGSDGIRVEPFDQAALNSTASSSARRVFVADRRRACERAVPTALLLWPEDAPPARMIGTSAPACLPGARVVVPLEGVRLEPRRDTALRGLLLEEASASDRAAFFLGPHGLEEPLAQPLLIARGELAEGGADHPAALFLFRPDHLGGDLQ